MSALVDKDSASFAQAIPRNHLSWIIDPANWSDNPLAVREMRRDYRRRQPHLSYLWLLVTLTLVTILVLWGVFALRRRGFGIPWMLGGNPGTALCIALCGVHAWFITSVAQKHSARFIQREANAGTLPSLLTLPLSAFQILFSAAIYPWIAAMRIALVGLPFYSLCLALGLPLVDLLLLYIVYAAIALAIPTWTRPILSEKSAFVPTVPGQTQSVSMAFGRQQVTANAGAQPTGFHPGTFLSLVGMSGFLFPFLLRGGFLRGVSSLREYATFNIIELLPSALLSWPLLMGRTLVTPFDWFGMPIAPLPFIAISFLLGHYIQTVKSAEYLRVGSYRDLPSMSTYVPVRRLAGALRIGRLFVVAGYLWKWAVVKGGLSFLTTIPGPASAPGLGGFAYVLMFASGWRLLIHAAAVGMWFSPRPLAPERGIAFSTTTRDCVRYLAEPLAFAFTFYLACCALSFTSPLHGPILAMIGQMTLIAIGGALLGYSVRRVGGEVATVASAASLLVIPLIAVGPPGAAAFSIISPTLGLARYENSSYLLNHPQVLERKNQVRGLITYLKSPPPWWHWPLACGGGALAFSPFWLRKRRTTEKADSVAPVVLNPARCGMEVYSDWIFEKDRGKKGETTPIAARLISIAGMFGDNAITIREMRVRLRNRLSGKDIRILILALVVITILMMLAPAVTMTFGGPFVSYLLPKSAPFPASVVICWYMALLWLTAAVGMGMTAVAFAPEREKSTLGFVLLTPMSAARIVIGKMMGYLLSAGLSVALLICWALLLSLLLLGGSWSALQLWCQATVSSLMLAITLAAVGIAIAAMFPRRVKQLGCGMFILIICTQIPIQLGIGTGRALQRGGALSMLGGWDAGTYWLVFLAGSMLISVLSFLIAVWGVRRMRKGDIAFESVKQSG